jgi:hypothetical protein
MVLVWAPCPRGNTRAYGYCVFSEEGERARALAATTHLRSTHKVFVCNCFRGAYEACGFLSTICVCVRCGAIQIRCCMPVSRLDGMPGAVVPWSTSERIVTEPHAVSRLTRLQIMHIQDLRRQQAIDRRDPVPPPPDPAGPPPCWNYQYSLQYLFLFFPFSSSICAKFLPQHDRALLLVATHLIFFSSGARMLYARSAHARHLTRAHGFFFVVAVVTEVVTANLHTRGVSTIHLCPVTAASDAYCLWPYQLTVQTRPMAACGTTFHGNLRPLLALAPR